MNEHNEKTLKKALQESGKMQDEEFLKEIQEANSNPLYQLQEGEVEAFVNENMPKAKKKSKKMFLRVASIFIAVAICLTTVTLSVEGFRESFVEFLSNFSSSDFASIDIGNEKDDELLLSFEGQYVPTYIPEGYSVENVSNSDGLKEICFIDEDNNIIIFREQKAEQKSNIDDENADSVENIEINGMKGVLVVKNGTKTIALTTENSILYLYCDDIDIDLLGFAELVEKR